MNFTFSFPSKYKGKFADTLKLKLRAFVWTLIIAAVLLVVSVIVLFAMSDFTFGGSNRFTVGLLLFYASLLHVVASPFVLLFAGINVGLRGQITVSFISDETGECNLTLQAVRRGKPYCTSQRINLIEVEKTYAKIATLNGNTYVVPFGCISEENRQNVIALDKQIRNARAQSVRN